MVLSKCSSSSCLKHELQTTRAVSYSSQMVRAKMSRGDKPRPRKSPILAYFHLPHCSWLLLGLLPEDGEENHGTISYHILHPNLHDWRNMDKTIQRCRTASRHNSLDHHQLKDSPRRVNLSLLHVSFGTWLHQQPRSMPRPPTETWDCALALHLRTTSSSIVCSGPYLFDEHRKRFLFWPSQWR